MVIVALLAAPQACTGLTPQDEARIAELMQASTQRTLTEAEVIELKEIWEQRGEFSWERLLELLGTAAGSVLVALGVVAKQRGAPKPMDPAKARMLELIAERELSKTPPSVG